MNKTEEIMVNTMEECGELVQACSKAIRRGEMFRNSDSEITFKEEVGDVYTMICLLVEHGYITWDEISQREKIKRAKLKKWSKLDILDDPHPPKSEEKEKNFPSNSVTWRQSTDYNYVDERGYGRVTYVKEDNTNWSSEPMSEYEEREWERIEQIMESQKRGKETI
jgi:NTP pyrophosphatase (non-canonical NTP hydrolase)